MTSNKLAILLLTLVLFSCDNSVEEIDPILSPPEWIHGRWSHETISLVWSFDENRVSEVWFDSFSHIDHIVENSLEVEEIITGDEYEFRYFENGVENHFKFELLANLNLRYTDSKLHRNRPGLILRRGNN